MGDTDQSKGRSAYGVPRGHLAYFQFLCEISNFAVFKNNWPTGNDFPITLLMGHFAQIWLFDKFHIKNVDDISLYEYHYVINRRISGTEEWSSAPGSRVIWSVSIIGLRIVATTGFLMIWSTLEGCDTDAYPAQIIASQWVKCALWNVQLENVIRSEEEAGMSHNLQWWMKIKLQTKINKGKGLWRNCKTYKHTSIV